MDKQQKIGLKSVISRIFLQKRKQLTLWKYRSLQPQEQIAFFCLMILARLKNEDVTLLPAKSFYQLLKLQLALLTSLQCSIFILV